MGIASLSRRITNGALLRQSLVLAGVFLCVGIATPHQASALTDDTFSEPKVVNPLKENEVKIQLLDITFKSTQDKIEETADQVEVVKAQADQAKQAKDQLAAEVADAKAEIEDLKVKIAEKKRLEALRIVNIASYASDSAGNTYAPGNCTWYAKSMRPDLSNGLGNANTWYSRAKAMGYKTGSMAKTGAVATSTRGPLGHVGYVVGWGEGTVTIREMNVNGLYSMQTKTYDESEFMYIYELP